MRQHLYSVAFIGIFAVSNLAAQTPVQIPFSEPSISPKGDDIAFVSGGDIWTVPNKGGDARLLVAHPATESRPLYAPDGKSLAFTSQRTGNGDVYVLNLATGGVKRLTFDDGFEQVSGWSRDGQRVFFNTTSQDIAGMNDIFSVSIEGETPVAVSADRYANEYFGAPAPDGSAIAFSARGVASGQWWRRGHSHIDESEIWLKRLNSDKYEPITEGGEKALWAMWSADSKTIFYVADRKGVQNIWSKSLNLTLKPTQLTRFDKGRVLWASISADGKTMVFERDFQIWKMDISSRRTAVVPINLVGTATTSNVERLRLSSGLSDLSVSPDGKKIAFVAHGEVFAASSKDGGDAERVSKSAAVEAEPVWTGNSKSVIYTSNRNGFSQLFQYDFVTRTESQLTKDNAHDGGVVVSPDGKRAAFIRDGKEIRVMNLTNKEHWVAAQGYFGTMVFGTLDNVVWSPDGNWLAFQGNGTKSFLNIYVVEVENNVTKSAQQVSFLPNSFGGNPVWSPDSTYLVFQSAQRTEDNVLAKVDLMSKVTKFREDQFRDLFLDDKKPTANTPLSKTEVKTDSTKATKPTEKADSVKAKPLKIEFENINRRLSLLPVGVSANEHAITKDGKTLVLIAFVAGQANLYTYSLDELSKEPPVLKPLTSSAGFKNNLILSPDGKEAYFLEQGRIQVIGIDSRQQRPLSVSAELDVDFHVEKVKAFEQAWYIQNIAFYDPEFHGVNWQEVKNQYAPVVAGAQTPDELRRLLNLMVGELNASHSGASSSSFSPFTVGRLGVRFDANEYERARKLRVQEVLAGSPAEVAKIKVGDYILAVDDSLITAQTPFLKLLENKIGKRVELKIAQNPSDTASQTVVVRPISIGAEKNLLYKNWVQQQRDFVFTASKGRLGYAHIPDMSSASLTQFYLDLDAENHAREGVVVDIRNNNGGFVNAYALDVLSRKPYMSMQPRGLKTAPARSQLGQRALESPTILVTNQHSLSDAEDFSEGYRTLKLGKIVGEPTAGWIIYTSGVQLIDGTNLRLPFIKITDNAGKNMELAPRPVDIPVKRPIGESYTPKNVQLETAVKELLQQLDKK
jgi:tricorn protease